MEAPMSLHLMQEDEIAAGQAQIDSKTQELADTDEKNAQAKEDVADTKKSLSADEQFLMMLKEKCSMTDSEWEERQKTRQLEMEACSKALAVLSSDDAHDLLTRAPSETEFYRVPRTAYFWVSPTVYRVTLTRTLPRTASLHTCSTAYRVF